jgi:Papain family cysteine protease
VLESTVAIKYGTSPLKLSAQHNLECMKNQTGNPGINACSGGRPEWVWGYSKNQKGIVPESSHTPYNEIHTGACVAGIPRDVRSEVDYWVTIPSDEEAIKCRVANYGPIHVSISIEKTSLEKYASGIWDDPEGNCLAGRIIDHAVYLVGYGTEVGQTGQSIDYWLVQNSWNTGYGMDGFFKMERGINLCLIANDAMYPVLKSATPQLLSPIYPPTGCIMSGDVYSASGAYIKSFCSNNFGRNYEDSRLACLGNGMRLYQLDSAEANSTLLNVATTTWTENYYVVEFFTNGKEQEGCGGISNDNPFGPVISSLKRVTS